MTRLIACLFFSLLFVNHARADITKPKEDIQGFVGACGHNAALDTSNPFMGRNLTNAPQTVGCTPRTDPGQDGAHTAGLVISNLQANNRPVTCRAYFNSGGGGIISHTKSMLVGPNKSQRIYWTAAEMGLGKSFNGQVSFSCVLLPGMAAQWIYTLSVGG